MRRITVLAVCAVTVFVLGIAAAIATPPKDATRTDVARAVMTTGGPVDFEPGKETTIRWSSRRAVPPSSPCTPTTPTWC
jgi:hypothetical protein